MRIFTWSTKSILHEIQMALLRFTLPMILATLGTFTGITLLHDTGSELFPKIILTTIIWFPMSIALALYLEKRHSSLLTNLLATIGLIVIIFGYFFLLPHSLSTIPSIYFVYAVLLFFMGLLSMTLSPRGTLKEYYWEHTIGLLFNAIVTIFCAVCIYIAIVVAFGSITLLFDTTIEPTRYGEMWCLVTGIFSPLFFLSRVPKITTPQYTTHEVAFALQWFTQYIALPATGIYFAILYAYSAKILLTNTWPSGQVSFMVLGFSILGLFNYLILHSKLSEMHRARLWKSLFFIILLPQVGMLFLAAWMRISTVGITENRYALIAGGVWLTLISCYFLISKYKRLEFLSVSLLAIFLIGSFSPWNIAAVSKESQMHELSSLLEKHGILKNNTITTISTPVRGNDANRIYNIVAYLSTTHSTQVFAPWFGKDMKTSSAADVIKWLNVEPALGYSSREDGITACYLNSITDDSMDVTGYDRFIRSISSNGTSIESFSHLQKNYTFQIDETKHLILKNENQVLLSADILAPLIETLKSKCAQSEIGKSVPSKDMIFAFENDKVRIKLSLSSLYGDMKFQEQKTGVLNDFSGLVLIDIK